MKKRLLVLAVLMSLMMVFGGVFSQEQEQEMVEISGEEVFSMFKRDFPGLKAGQGLFVTTGVYHAYPLNSYLQIFTAVKEEEKFPPCRFKAVTVILGELHKRLNGLIAAGYAMSERFPPWFIVFVAIDCYGKKILYGFDVVEGYIVTEDQPLRSIPMRSIPRINLILF